jgi:hypothetical protein
MRYLSHLTAPPGTARLQPRVSIKPPRSGFRSAEGRSEGEAETTDLIAFALPKSATASKISVKPNPSQQIRQPKRNKQLKSRNLPNKIKALQQKYPGWH